MDNKKIQAVFFDLDGTLLDTAPDLAYAMNLLLDEHNKPPLVFDDFRFHIYGGTKTMLAHALAIDESDANYQDIRESYLQKYRQHLTKATTFFPYIEQVLEHLDELGIPWGIITNKPGWLTQPLMEHFAIDSRSCCIISGDDLEKRKPHPDPLLHAATLSQIDPTRAIYVGDTETDVIAARAAGMFSISMLYGYHQRDSRPDQWPTHALLETAAEIMTWVERFNTHLANTEHE